MARSRLAKSATPLDRRSLSRASRTTTALARSPLSRAARIVFVAGLALVVMLMLTSAVGGLAHGMTPDARRLIDGAMSVLTVLVVLGGVIVGSRW